MNQLIPVIVITVLSFLNVAQAANKANDLISEKLAELVSQQRNEANLVGLGAMVMHHGKIIAGSVEGEREAGTKVALSDRDTWHIGSVTKSFTATLIARLVERGILSWDTRIEDIFSDDIVMNPMWRGVTLEQLLTHTSGAPRNFSFFSGFDNPGEGIERIKAREEQVLKILRDEPETTPGSTFSYSNVGITIAGTIAEKVTHLPWETLIRQEIFTTLKLRSGGFGAVQDESNALEQPRGHGRFLGFLTSNQDDNPSIIGPAGTIHLTMADLLTYANEHMKGERGQGQLLTEKTYQHLHKPVTNNYAYGWAVKSNSSWTSGPVIWHNGSNGSWYTLIAFIPSLDLCVVVNSNEGNVSGAEKGAWEIIKQVAILLQVKN